MKKMKERQAVLAPRVEHARSIKAKLAEIHALLCKGVIEGSIVRNLRGYLNDFMGVTEDQVPANLKASLDSEMNSIQEKIRDITEPKAASNGHMLAG